LARENARQALALAKTTTTQRGPAAVRAQLFGDDDDDDVGDGGDGGRPHGGGAVGGRGQDGGGKGSTGAGLSDTRARNATAAKRIMESTPELQVCSPI